MPYPEDSEEFQTRIISGSVLVQEKNREILRLFKALGHEMSRLRRIHYGPFKLEALPLGAWRDILIENVRKVLFMRRS